MKRFFLVLLTIMGFSVGSALSSEHAEGVWTGGFSCANGQIGATITFTPSPPRRSGELRHPRKARLDFYEVEGGASMPDGSVSLNLSYLADGEMRLRQNRWIEKPSGWRAKRDRPMGWKEKLKIRARINGAKGVLEGQVVSDDCGSAFFTLQGFIASEVDIATGEKLDSDRLDERQRFADIENALAAATKRRADRTPRATGSTRQEELLEVKGTSQVIPGLDGRFEGAYFCKDGIGEASMTFNVVDGDYRVTMAADGENKLFESKILSDRGDGAIRFELQDRRWRDEMAISQIVGGDVGRIGENAVFLNVSLGGLGSDCRGMLLYRFKPVDGLGGEYAAATGLHSACGIIRRHWLAEPEKEEAAARSLKTALPRLLAGYDTKVASASGIYGGTRFEQTFGAGVEGLDVEQQVNLRTQLRMCALLTSQEARDVFQTAFFVPGSLAQSIKVTISTWWDPQRDVPLAVPLKSVAERGRVAKEALDKIRALVDELLTMTDPDLVRQTAARQGIFNRDVLPTDLKTVLDPLVDHLSMLNRKRWAIQREGIGDLNVPYADIPEFAHPMFRQLARQENVSLDDSSMQYLGGTALFLASDCKLPEDVQLRERTLEFASTAANSAGLPKDFNVLNPITLLGGMRSSELSFKSGYENAQQLGCDAPFNRQVATLIGSGVATNRGEADELSLFVRSCAVDFDLPRCDCLQSQLQSVYPDIGTRDYHRRFIASTIQQNKVIGAAIVYRCKISDY